MRAEIVGSLKNLDPALTQELLEEREQLVLAHQRKDYEKALLKAGKFAETLFQIFSGMLHDSPPSKLDMKKISEELEGFPSNEISDSIRVIIPRLARVIYSIRSKRGGGHKTPVPPQEIDSALCVSATGYVLAELLRLYSDLPENQTRHYIHKFVRRPSQLVEEFEDDEVIILSECKSCKDKILILLHHFYPARVGVNKFSSILKEESRENIHASLSYAQKKKLVHNKKEGSTLTVLGLDYVEEEFMNEK